MIQAQDYIYSKAAIARMLKVSEKAVTRIEKWPVNCHSTFSILFIIVKGRRPRFWKKLDFLCHFADWRRSQSKELVVDRLMPAVFAVINKKKQSKYVIKITPDSINCTCEDYKNQIKFLPKAGACKHGYAVLKKMGFSRLSEYIKGNGYQKALDGYKKEHATKLRVERTDAYSFAIQDTHNIYYCDLHPSIIKCSCFIYRTDKLSSEQFCTHGYAILNYLGFTGSQQIKDYRLGFEWLIDDYINEEPEVTAEQLRKEQEGMMEEDEYDEACDYYDEMQRRKYY